MAVADADISRVAPGRDVIRSSRLGNVTDHLLGAGPADVGDRPAIRTPDGIETYDRLAERVGAIAAGLLAGRDVLGRRVAVVLPDGPLWIESFLALARLGAVVAIVSPLTPHGHLRDAIRRLGASLVVSDVAGLAPPGTCVGSDRLTQMAQSGAADPGPAVTRPTDPCYMLLTSGSTGPAKWAVHRHRDIPTCIATYGRHVLALRPDDITWSVAPLATSYGLGNTLYFPFGAGASSWVTGAPPTPDEAARACIEGGATVLFGVPTFWARLARHAADGRVPASAFAHVRLAVSAGEPLPPAVWWRVHEVLGLELVDGLGSSEATNLYLSARRNRARADSLGWVVPGYELRVVDESGQPVPEGIPGELVVRGGTIMSGYLDAPEATERALRDGWLHTGDRVIRQFDASYRFVGRLGERFKSGGLWVDPVQIETVLSAHPDVAEVAVTSVPDAAEIRRVAAVVVARDGHEPNDVRHALAQLAADQLAPHEIPREYRFVSRLPTAASGKVRRGELAQLLESQPVEAVTA